MHEPAPAATTGQPSILAGRYHVDGLLGRGGMGAVYRVTDAISGGCLALKRLHDNVVGASRLHREYALLSELTHPSIIRVYDYGLDADGPYYTMELLDGPSLSERVPLDPREASRLMSDVASSLAVLHARRLLHRDVTLRNIHCTSEGRGKLLDFGAVAGMGVSAGRVGTPPYLSPEALAGRPLDARSDLFALGAALYCLLTGKHAYPAAHFDELRAYWRSAPKAPHELIGEVPLALSQLTMSLLSLDPLVRPASAAEVIERLSALAGLASQETADVRKAFLATPALVGRTRGLERIRAYLGQASVPRPDVLIITGPAGAGRSRMLEAVVSEARLAGITPLRASGKDPRNEYGLLRAITSSALATLPQAHSEPAVRRLCELLSMAPARLAVGAASDVPALGVLRRELHRAAASCLRALAAQRPLLLAVDDIDRADEPSVACVTALRELHGLGLRIALTQASDQTPHARPAIEWLCKDSTRIELPNLTQPQVLELLSSVFGDVPNIALLADRVHTTSGGQPRWVLQLAEQLVESGAIRYESGAFIVPEQLRVERLPQTLRDALRARLASLGETARDLARGFLIDPEAWYTPTELARACELDEPRVEAALETLVAAGVLVRDRARLGLKHRTRLDDPSLDGDAAARASWHRRLAGLFARRNDAARAAQHAWAAGDRAGALTTLVDYCEALDQGLRRDPTLLDRVLAGLPAEFLQLLDLAVDECATLGYPKRAELCLRFASVRIGTLTSDDRCVPHVRALLAHLSVATGLLAWEHLDHIADPVERARAALEQARALYEGGTEHERGYPVPDAIRLLGAVRGHATGICSQTRDFALAKTLPSLAPLAPISPTLARTHDIAEASAHLQAGRNLQGQAAYLKFLERLDGEAGAAGDPVGNRFNRFGSYYPLGMLAAWRGQSQALEWADKLETEHLFEVSAWRVRMSYYRAHGDLLEAERCRRQAELLRIAHRPHEYWGQGAIAQELYYFMACEDLIGIRRSRRELEPVAARFPGWRPVLSLAHGEYCRLRGEPEAALVHFQAAFDQSEYGRDLVWQCAAAWQMSALIDLGQLERARELGWRWLDAARAAALRESTSQIEQRLALIEARLGAAQAATELAESVVRWLDIVDIRGVRAGVAHETRARVALLLGDQAVFERHLALCAQYFRTSKSPALCARYERILRDARAAGLRVEEAAIQLDPMPFDMAELRTRLQSCDDAQQRAASLLEMLVQDSGARGGALYVSGGDKLRLCAAIGGRDWSPELQFHVQDSHLAMPGSRASDPRQQLQETLEAPPSSISSDYRSCLLTQKHAAEISVFGVALLWDASELLQARPLELPSICVELLRPEP